MNLTNKFESDIDLLILFPNIDIINAFECNDRENDVSHERILAWC